MVASAQTMITCTLKKVAGARGYNNARELTEALKKKLGIEMSDSTLYPYWNDSIININKVTLDRLCEFLQVVPGELIQHIDEAALKQRNKK